MTVNNLPEIALVGMPNSGKSTLFNRLTHSSQAIVSEIAHTTRDTNRKIAHSKYGKFNVIDTAGYTNEKGQIPKAAMQQLANSLDLADAIIFIVDITVEPTSGDLSLAKLIRKSGKPVIVAVNKADDQRNSIPSTNFRKLGFEQIVPISAIHGIGIEELVGQLIKIIPSKKIIKKSITDSIKVAIIGRPNVGKSSLLNALAGKKLAIEADEPGTTRDTNEFSLNYHGSNITFIDTAGLRRPGKIAKAENIEFYSKVRTKKAIENSDICLMLIDSDDPATAQDQHLLGMIKDAQRGLIIVATKWDAAEKDSHTMAEVTSKLKSKLQFVWWAPLIFTSAKTRQNIDQLLKIIIDVNKRLDFSLSTPKLNRFLEDANAKNPPAAIKTKKPKVNYITQTGTRPLELTIFATHPEYMHWSYTRYLENQLREQHDLTGVPVAIKYKSKYKEGNRDRYKAKK